MENHVAQVVPVFFHQNIPLSRAIETLARWNEVQAIADYIAINASAPQ